MGTKVIRELYDDLDNDIAADETVSFAIDGQGYEMDLSKKNAEKLRAHLGPFVASARKVGRVSANKSKPSSSNSSGAGSGRTSEQLEEIRAWARTKGHTVSNRGRIPNEIIDAFEADQDGTLIEVPAKKAPAKKAAPPAASKEQPAFSGA
jgi:hypothetical protein